jgi:hypothetical protein
MTAIDTALQGLQSANALLDQSALRIASIPAGLGLSADAAAAAPAPDVVDLSAAVIGLLEAKSAHAMNIRMLDTLLDLDQHLIDVLG